MLFFILGCSVTLNLGFCFLLFYYFKIKSEDFFFKKSEGVCSNEKKFDDFDKLLNEKKEDKLMSNYFFGNSK